MFLALLHLLHEGFGLLFVDKGETGGAFFEFECVEKGSVLVVSEVIVDLLVPNYAPARRLQETALSALLLLSPKPIWFTYRDIDDFEPKGPSYKVVAEYRSTLDSGICPFLPIGVGDVESCDSYGEDLVGGFRDVPLDSFLIGITENGGHGESS
jgi:hypothetical protein